MIEPFLALLVLFCDMRAKEMMGQSDHDLNERASAEIATARDPLNVLTAVYSLGHDRIKALIVVAREGIARQSLEKELPDREAVNVGVLFGQALQMREDLLQQRDLIHDQTLCLSYLITVRVESVQLDDAKVILGQLIVVLDGVLIHDRAENILAFEPLPVHLSNVSRVSIWNKTKLFIITGSISMIGLNLH